MSVVWELLCFTGFEVVIYWGESKILKGRMSKNEETTQPTIVPFTKFFRTHARTHTHKHTFRDFLEQ